MPDHSALRSGVCRLRALLLVALCVASVVGHGHEHWDPVRHQRGRLRRYYNAARREDSDRDIHPQLHQQRRDGQRVTGSSSVSDRAGAGAGVLPHRKYRTISPPHSLTPLFVLASAQCDQPRLPYSTPSVALNTNRQGGQGGRGRHRCWRLCALLRGPAPLALILMVVMTTQFTKLLSFILANVHDPPMQPAYRLTCFSCMSQYLEEQYSYISYLYTKPQIFTDRCDEKLFDHRYLGYHNCTDMCITLRIDDRVGGRKRYGYLRGCMSDVLNYNDSTIRPFSYHDKCYHIRLRDLFARGSSLSYGFDESDHAHLCSCHNDRCNGATALRRTRYLTGFVALLALLSKYRLLFAH